jgi:hypothetical protein
MPRIAEPKIEYRPRKRVWVVTLSGRKIDECVIREGCEAFVKGWREAREERRTAQSTETQEEPKVTSIAKDVLNQALCRKYFTYMGAAWSVSGSGYLFLLNCAENDEPIDLDLTDAREIKRAPTGTQPLIGRELRYESRSR